MLEPLRNCPAFENKPNLWGTLTEWESRVQAETRPTIVPQTWWRFDWGIRTVSHKSHSITTHSIPPPCARTPQKLINSWAPSWIWGAQLWRKNGELRWMQGQPLPTRYVGGLHCIWEQSHNQNTHIESPHLYNISIKLLPRPVLALLEIRQYFTKLT